MNEALFVISAKALQQPLSSWGQACVVKLLCHAVARLAQDDWREAIEAAQRAYAREQRLNDGRKYASKFLRALREAAKGKIHAIDQNRVAARVEARPMGELHTLQDHMARASRPAPVPCPEPAREPVPAPGDGPAIAPERPTKRPPPAKLEIKREPDDVRARALTSDELAHLQMLRDAGWQWGDIARAADIKQGVLSRIVKGRRQTTPEKIERLMQVRGERPTSSPDGRRHLTPSEIAQIEAYPGGLGGLQAATGLWPKVMGQALAGSFRMRPTEIAKLLEVTKTESPKEEPKTKPPKKERIDDRAKQAKEEGQGQPDRDRGAAMGDRARQAGEVRGATKDLLGPTLPGRSDDQPGERATERSEVREAHGEDSPSGGDRVVLARETAQPLPAPRVTREKAQPTAPEHRALRDRYWSAIAARDGRQITAATQACKAAGMSELLDTTIEHLSRIEEPELRAPREHAVRVWRTI